MSDIPSDVFSEILLRLPAESLLRFSAVCKEWRRTIANPTFFKTHTDNHQLLSTNLIIVSWDSLSLECFSLESIDFVDGCQSQTVEVSPVKPLIYRGVRKKPGLPVPSCNGLMLLTHIDHPNKTWVIWNPFTRDFHRFDVHLDVKYLFGIGLGYDSATADYKVVRIDELYRTHVYSLKLLTWKMIKNCPYCFPRVWYDNGVFLNGSLHWSSYDMIIALDLASEDYYQLPLPQELTGRKRDGNVYLDAFSGNLVLSCYQTEDSFVGWVMEDCKVEKSWRKLFSLDMVLDAVLRVILGL